MPIQQWKLGPMANFTYLVHDAATGEAALVDPGWEVPRALELALAAGARVTRILLTHGHFDHVQGAPAAKRALPGAKVVAHASSDVPHDVGVKDGDELSLGATHIRVLHTPGHRFDSVCYVVDERHILTGDTLFVGGCGRIDLPGADSAAMHKSLTETLRALNDELEVLPGHDYGSTPTSTLGREKRDNETMRPRSLREFLEFMAAP